MHLLMAQYDYYLKVPKSKISTLTIQHYQVGTAAFQADQHFHQLMESHEKITMDTLNDRQDKQVQQKHQETFSTTQPTHPTPITHTNHAIHHHHHSHHEQHDV